MPDLHIKTILLVEDDKSTSLLESRLLQKNGYQVIPVFSGEEALREAPRQKIDLVLMDIDLGSGMDGTQAASQILVHHDIPLIFLLSHTEPEIVAKTEGITSYGYIVKNSGETVLIASIKMAFRLFDEKQKVRQQQQDLIATNERLRLSETKIAEALQQAQLRQKEISALFEASQSIPMCQSFEEEALVIFTMAKNLIGATSGFVSTVESSGETGKLLFIETSGNLIKNPQGLAMPLRGFREVAFRMQKAVFENHFSQSQWAQLLPAEHVSLENVLIAPMVIQGKTIGLIALANKKGGFTENDANLAKSFSDLAAIALTYITYQEDLKRQEEQTRLLFQNMFIGFALHEVVLNESGKPVDYIIRDINPAYEKLTGLQKELVLNRRIKSVLPHIEDEWIETAGRVALTGKPIRREQYTASLKKYFSITVFCPKINFFATLFDDITAQKQAQQELLRSEERFRYTFDKAAVGIAHVTQDGRFLRINERFCQIVGYSEAQMLTKTFQEITHPEDLIQDKRYVQDLLAGKLQTYNMEKRYFRKNGSIVWVLLTVSLMRDEEGQEDYFISVVEDITEFKKAEEEIRYQARLLNATGQAVLVFDIDGYIQYMNEAAEDLYGKKRFELLGSHIDILPIISASGDSYYSYLQNRSREDFTSAEFVVSKGAQGDVYLRVSFSSIYDADGTVSSLITIASDISELKRERDILAAQMRLVDYAPSHSIHELLQRFLDEAEALTGSSIGFYHFMEDDQETLSLQTWSTNTLNSMCTAEGAGSHYPVSKAGVWVDCVRERRSVIHNDYAALTHKRGLPDGHAPVVRELVVPVLRDNKIMAILGVGNKKSNYVEHDVHAVHLLANLAWEIVDRKKTLDQFKLREEQLHSLINATPDIICFKDGEGKWLEANEADLRLFHLQGVDYFGKTDAQLAEYTHQVFADSFRACEATDAEAWTKGELSRGEEVICGPEKEKKVYDVLKIPLFHADHSRKGLVVFGRDITERKEAEEQVRLLLAEKELILREVHHRIKNNMHTIMGILNLQADALQDYQGKKELESVVNRISGMMLLYDRLYRTGEYQNISLRAYLSTLVDQIVSTFPIHLKVEMDIPDKPIANSVASSVGIIVNELIANSMKYAFTERGDNLLRVRGVLEGAEIILTIADNGPGFDLKRKTGGFGLDLVELMARQISGSLSIRVEQGVTAVLRFQSGIS